MTALCMGLPAQMLSTQPSRAPIAAPALRLRSSPTASQQGSAAPRPPCATTTGRRQLSPNQAQRGGRRIVCRAEHSQANGQPDDSKFEDAEYDKLADDIRGLAAAVKEQLGGTSIYLVGMMGSGKSTVGKLLSAALGYYFFDSDSLVEAHARLTVQEIFEEEGEEAFREVETAVLQELAPFRDCVVATGGGAVLQRTNWGHMSHAVSVWLDGPPPLLAARLVADGTASRPLVAKTEAEEEEDEYQATVAKLSDLLHARSKHYSIADVRVPLAHPGGDENRGAAPVLVAHRVLTSLRDRLASKKAELEEKRTSEVKIVDAAQTPEQ